MQLFNVRYEPLCVVELQHEYYTHKRFADFQLQPTAATEILMRQYGLLLKRIENKYYLLAQTEQMRPKRMLDKTLCWSFFLYLKNEYFTNFTNIRLDSFRQHLYHFSNLANNAPNKVPFLTRPIASYQKNMVYQLGDWVQTPDGKCWEAIATTITQAPKADSEQWQPCATTTPCASFQDRLPVLSVAQALNDIAQQPLLGLDSASANYNQAVLPKQLAERPALYYRPKADNATAWCYVGDKAWYQSPFAVIDIHYHPALSSDYALLDDKQQLRSPNYVIRFGNRSTLWRYLIYNKTADLLQDKSAQYQFVKINDCEFVSKKPIPLTQEPLRSLMLQIPTFGAVNPLPNPGVAQIIPQEGKIYSNIHLNY